MRLSTAAVGELIQEIDGAAKMEGSVRVDVNVQRLIIGGRVEDADVARLHKVVGHHDVFLVRRDLDVMRANGGLVVVRVIQPFDVVQIGDVEGRDVVGRCEGDWLLEFQRKSFTGFKDGRGCLQ